MFRRIKRFITKRKVNRDSLHKLDNVLEVNRLNDRISALQVSLEESNSALKEHIEDELQRLIDDLDFDSFMARDNFSEMVADIVRDELSDVSISIDVR
jgi:hypothetical protein